MDNLKQLYKKPRTVRASWLAICVCALALLFPPDLCAQSRSITGTVIDENGAPLPGATVITEDGRTGVTTGGDGTFRLSVATGLKSLSVMYLGYITETVALGTAGDYLISLKPESHAIDDVVVVAYGTQKKVAVTGALSSVEGTELRRSVTSNFSAALSGRLPGLTVTQASGMPGDERISLNLRGISTFGGDNSPLILIDGVPREPEVLNSLDPNEVESAVTLKDASATSVFGVRGANGVIYITTKRGREGKTDVSIKADYGVQQMLVRGALKTNSWDYAALLNERNRNVGLPAAYNEWQIERFRSGEDPLFFPNRDPYKEYTKLGNQWKINANVSGGTDRLQYFVNATYLEQGSVFRFLPASKLGYDPSIWLKRINVRANIDYKITPRLKVSVNVGSYLNRTNKIIWGDNLWEDKVNFGDTGATYIVGGLNRIPPTAPGPSIPADTFDKNGNPLPEGGWVQDGSGYQLYPRMNLGGYIRQMKTTVNSSASLEWDMASLVEGLTFRTMFSYDLYASGWTKGTRGYNRYGFHQATGPGDTSFFEQQYSDNTFDGYHAETGLRFFDGGRGQLSDYKFNTQAGFNFSRRFGKKHDVSALLLGQWDNYVQSNDKTHLPFNMLYMSARATYTYDNRYTAEFNMGLNASEQFAKGKRGAIFPAVSVGWTVSEEKFFKRAVDARWIDFLKVRASYGVVGNDRIGNNRFLYLDDIRMLDNGPIPTLGFGRWVNTTQLGNPLLSWENSEQQNYGIDIGFLGGFSFTMEYFRELRSDILIHRGSIPTAQGFLPEWLPAVNMGRMRNHGFETSLSYSKTFNKEWSVNFSGNFNFVRNRVLEADEVERPTGRRGDFLYPYQNRGFTLGQNWMLQVDYQDGAGNGYINTERDLAKYSKMYEDGGFVRQAFMGQWKFVDQNGDGIIDIKDRVPMGHPDLVPEITYGFTAAATWRGLDVSMQWQGVAHHQGFRVFGMMGQGHLTGEWELHAWTPERFARGERITYQALNMGTLADNPNERNNYVLCDLSFIRLKNVEIGYSLPQPWMKKIGVGGIRVAVAGQNLWNTNNMKTRSMDPEQNNENQYPMTRNVSLSVSIKL